MKKYKLRIATFTLLMLSVILIGCGAAATSKSGTLRVGVRDDIMNFGYQNKDTGRYYGLEIDLANRLAEKLGYGGVEYVTVQPENRKEKLLNGDVDCLIACYSIAETRLANFDFSAPYYEDKIRILVEKSTMFDSIEDLKDKKLGVLTGANTAVLVGIKMHELGLLPAFDESNFDPVTFNQGLSYYSAEHYSDLDVALEQGDVDAICMDGSIAQGFMNGNRIYLDEAIAEQEYGVATQKDSKLSGPVADAIQQMLDDGTIAELIDKWD